METNFKTGNNKSVARWYDPFVSVMVVCLTYFALAKSTLSNTELVLAILATTTVYMFMIEILRSKWPKQNLLQVFTGKSKIEIRDTFKNIFIKYFGIIFGILLMLFCYWLIPEYHLVKYVKPIGEGRNIFLIVFLPIAFLLVTVTEFILGPKRDGTYQMGLLFLLKVKEIDWKVLKDGLFEWLVKLIFLTLNFTTSVTLINTFRKSTFSFLESDFISKVSWLESTIFLVIILVILPGYLFSSRLINTHVRKVDATWFAWTITLICYQPFIRPIFGNVVDYYPNMVIHNNLPVWASLTMDLPFLLYLVGVGIVFFALIHLWGEAMMGIRSSNLCNRGIITNGPFAFTKHPVYVSKCFAWALITMPFLNSFSVMDSFRLGILFLIVCAIFAGRAFAEEKYLSEDRDYVNYALELDKKGVFRFVGKIFPPMTFAWRLNYWESKQVKFNN